MMRNKSITINKYENAGALSKENYIFDRFFIDFWQTFNAYHLII